MSDGTSQETSSSAPARTASAQPASGPPEPTLFTSLLRHWKLCLASPVAVGIAAYLVTFALPKSYTAEARVMSAAIDFGGQQIGLRALSARGLEGFFRRPENVEEVIRRFGLDQQYGYDAARFLDEAVEIEVPREADTVMIRAELPVAALSRDVAEAIARRGVASYVTEMVAEYERMEEKLQERASSTEGEYKQAEQELSRLQGETAPEVLRSRLDAGLEQWAAWHARRDALELEIAVLAAQADVHRKELEGGALAESFRKSLTQRARLNEALSELGRIEEELLEERLESQVAAVEQRIATEQELRGTYLRARAQQTVDLAGAKEKVARLSAALAEIPQVIELRSRLVDDPALQQFLAGLTGEGMDRLAGIALTTTALNPAHYALASALEGSRGEQGRLTGSLAETDRRLAEAEGSLAELETQLVALRQKLRPGLNRRELAEARIEAARNAAKEAEDVLSAVYVPAARGLLDVERQRAMLAAEMEQVGGALKAGGKKAEQLRIELAQKESRLREQERLRDAAKRAALEAADHLRRLESVPIWPPQRLTVIPPVVPEAASRPKRLRIAVAAFGVAFVLAWGVAVLMDRRGAGLA